MTGYMRGAALALVLATGASAQGLGVDPAKFESAVLDLGTPFNMSSYEEPFANGPLAILVPGGGKLETYSLSLCQDGQAVCAGNRVGSVSREGGHTVVRGLFGRVFYLHKGGSGILERAGEQRVLAWNARANGTSD